jgi:hypothetical protein
MTHLVVNRFFDKQLPLWLNEGVAEYFGLKKTSDNGSFHRHVSQWPAFGVDRLFETKQYPANMKEMHSFYAEAAIVVDFLTKTSDRRALLPKFIETMIENDDVDTALKIYGYKSRDDFKKAYARHRMLFNSR